MFKELFSGLAPLLAVAAFAVIPVAAQATGHYYSNGLKIAEGSKKTVIEWGTITLAGGIESAPCGARNTAWHLTCHTAATGTVENPVGGLRGVGATEAYAAYQCESENAVPTGTVARLMPEKIENGVGWPTAVIEPEPGKWRVEGSKVKVRIACAPVDGTRNNSRLGTLRRDRWIRKRNARPRAETGTPQRHQRSAPGRFRLRRRIWGTASRSHTDSKGQIRR
jgi:hypothetical protein